MEASERQDASHSGTANASTTTSTTTTSATSTTSGSESLRICCYGSSSRKTPASYLEVSRELGRLLAQRGHVCVNGAGMHGCMGALNEGADAEGGHIVGVLHRMFVVDDGNDWMQSAHSSSLSSSGQRELLLADGPDLQQRKKLLVKGVQGIAVLPGGTGTWDEVWEMACCRNISLPHAPPIVCINVDGFYEPFRQMLQRAHKDGLLYQSPEFLIAFVSTAQEAVDYLEQKAKEEAATRKHRPMKTILREPLKRRDSRFFRGSFLASWSLSDFDDKEEDEEEDTSNYFSSKHGKSTKADLMAALDETTTTNSGDLKKRNKLNETTTSFVSGVLCGAAVTAALLVVWTRSRST